MMKLFKRIMIISAVPVIMLLIALYAVRSWSQTPYGTLDPRAAVLLKFMKIADIGLFKEGRPLEESRKTSESSDFLRGRGVPMASVTDGQVPVPGGTVPLRVYVPVKKARLPIIVYYHGGGWFMGSIKSHDHVCRLLAKYSEAVVVSIGYRLAPEHKFPAAVEDAYAGLQWTHANAGIFGGDKHRIAVAGDSAGGNLAAVVSLLARDRQGPKISCQVLIYPATNLSRMDTESYKQFAEGYYLTKAYSEKFRSLYVPDPKLWKDPHVSPLLERSMKNLPPAIVLTSEFDVLRDEGEDYSRKLEAAGVKVMRHRFKGLIHGFIVMDNLFPQSHEAICMIADELKKNM